MVVGGGDGDNDAGRGQIICIVPRPTNNNNNVGQWLVRNGETVLEETTRATNLVTQDCP